MTGGSTATAWSGLRYVVVCADCTTLGRTASPETAAAVIAHHHATRGHTARVEPVTPPGKAVA